MSTFTEQDLDQFPTSRGRGFQDGLDDGRYAGDAGDFDSLESQQNAPAQRSVEGWVLFVTGIQEEHTEEDIQDLFRDFGDVRQIRMPLSRTTGHPYGFCLVQYPSLASAKDAMEQLNGSEVLNTVLHVSWAFQKD